HYDIHEGNLMFNTAKTKTTRSYKVADFYVTIMDSVIEPKLIDYGKSVMDPEYADARWREPQFKKFWNKSDVYHLSRIFSMRENLSDKFRRFLEQDALPTYENSRYATKLENDSAANFKNIEVLLERYFGKNQTIYCRICSGTMAKFRIGNVFLC